MNSIQGFMEKAGRYLRSAELLPQDADYDSAVSRAYYAMFYAAEAVLLTKDMAFSSHKAVISAFGKYFVKTGIFDRQMGKDLNIISMRGNWVTMNPCFLYLKTMPTMRLRSLRDLLTQFLVG